MNKTDIWEKKFAVNQPCGRSWTAAYKMCDWLYAFVNKLHMHVTLLQALAMPSTKNPNKKLVTKKRNWRFSRLCHIAVILQNMTHLGKGSARSGEVFCDWMFMGFMATCMDVCLSVHMNEKGAQATKMWEINA